MKRTETKPREKARKSKGGRAAVVALKDYAEGGTLHLMIPEVPAYQKRAHARRS